MCKAESSWKMCVLKMSCFMVTHVISLYPKVSNLEFKSSAFSASGKNKGALKRGDTTLEITTLLASFPKSFYLL